MRESAFTIKKGKTHMPTYEYECLNCKKITEKFQNIKDKPLKKCPHCGGVLKRLIGGGAGFIFKGGGFYATDYRSDSYKKKEKEESSNKIGDKKPTACQKCPQGNTCPANK